MCSPGRCPGEARSLSTQSWRLNITLAASVLCLILISSIGSAADAAPKKIKTLSIAPIPEATTIEIRLPVEEPSDELRLAVKLADHFSNLLGALGYKTVKGDSELILRFEVEEPTYAGRSNNFRFGSKINEQNLIQRTSQEVRPLVHTNLAAASDGNDDTYSLRVSVAQARKPPLWIGFVEQSVKGAERQDVYLRMAEELLEFWGKTHTSPD